MWHAACGRRQAASILWWWHIDILNKKKIFSKCKFDMRQAAGGKRPVYYNDRNETSKEININLWVWLAACGRRQAASILWWSYWDIKRIYCQCMSLTCGMWQAARIHQGPVTEMLVFSIKEYCFCGWEDFAVCGKRLKARAKKISIIDNIYIYISNCIIVWYSIIQYSIFQIMILHKYNKSI